VSKTQLILHQFNQNQLVDEMNFSSGCTVYPTTALITGPCFHVCEDLNGETHCGMGDLVKMT
jgi:hypothetical protein